MPYSRESRLNWMKNDGIRPYVFLRQANRIARPGLHQLNWFTDDPLVKDSQKMAERDFTAQIINLENRVFGAAGLAMPKWVFYDCGVMPGVVAGYAMKRSHAPRSFLEITQPESSSEWIPLSLFIIIPTMTQGEWVAHNLSSINSALPEGERLWGLGFMSKAFGLWYSNIDICCGMTQWRGPAIRLHSHYGDMQILTAYTPSHSVAETLTYRLKVNMSEWDRFFTHQPSERFNREFERTEVVVKRAETQSLMSLQRRIEAQEGPYFLDASEIDERPLDSDLHIYRRRRT